MTSGAGYWVDLIEAQTRLLRGRYTTRIIEAGHGPTLLLLHGTGGHAENYARNIGRLSQHHHVVAMDFLWHGRSQVDGFTPTIFPALVDQVLDVLEVLGVEKAFVEGQSLGGWVAMLTALWHPDRVERLILTTTMGYTPDPGSIEGYVEPDWSANLASSLETLRNPTTQNVRARMERILADPTRLTDEAIAVRQALYRDPAVSEVQQRFITEYLGGGECWRYVVTDELARQIAAPTLVYWGDRNRTPPALGQRLAQQVASGQFHCAADTGHWAQFESADEHDRVVLEFLAGSGEDTS